MGLVAFMDIVHPLTELSWTIVHLISYFSFFMENYGIWWKIS